MFGPRQDPNGPYAAVIPRWIAAQLSGKPCVIYGDGSASRDFCYVRNVVQANLLSATCSAAAIGNVFNIAVGERTDLIALHRMIWEAVQPYAKAGYLPPRHEAPRPGDVAHSQADIAKARQFLGYEPSHYLKDGLAETVDRYSGSQRLTS